MEQQFGKLSSFCCRKKNNSNNKKIKSKFIKKSIILTCSCCFLERLVALAGETTTGCVPEARLLERVLRRP